MGNLTGTTAPVKGSTGTAAKPTGTAAASSHADQIQGAAPMTPPITTPSTAPLAAPFGASGAIAAGDGVLAGGIDGAHGAAAEKLVNDFGRKALEKRIEKSR